MSKKVTIVIPSRMDSTRLYGKPLRIIAGKPLVYWVIKAALKVKNIDQIKVEDYDLLVLPGGVKAMEKVRQEKKIIKFISDFDKQKKIIACICSGAQLLISACIVKERKIAGYYSMKDDLINAGAIYTDEPAVIDENVITTAHYKDMGPWMREVIKKFD